MKKENGNGMMDHLLITQIGLMANQIIIMAMRTACIWMGIIVNGMMQDVIEMIEVGIFISFVQN